MFVHGLDDYPFRPLRCLVYPDLSFGYLNLFHSSVPPFIDNVDTNDDLLLDDLDVTMDLSDIVEDTTNDSDE